MRRALALEASLALLFAFVLAPFQHVHQGEGADHDHSSIIHAHFYALDEEIPEHHGAGLKLEHADDKHTASPLDTFTVVPSAVFAIALPAQSIGMIAIPPASATPVECVEERAHDPPEATPFPPRSPPV